MEFTAKIDGNKETIHADSIEGAMKKAVGMAERGDWDMAGGTIWVNVSVEDADGNEESERNVPIHPAAPACDGGEHDWQSPYEIVGGIEENPGVWGNGGGVVITECCMKCGCKKVTDTWAQNPENGEQGLTSIQYEEGAFSEKMAAAEEK